LVDEGAGLGKTALPETGRDGRMWKIFATRRRGNHGTREISYAAEGRMSDYDSQTTRILLEMTSERSSRTPRSPAAPPTRPGWLTRLHARTLSRPLAWLDWHFATIAAVLVGFGLLLWVLSPILAPFLAAAILAYILDPLVDKLEARGVPRSGATVIAVLLLLLAIVLLLVIILPLFYKEISQLIEQMPGFVEQIKTTALPWVNEKLGVSITLDPSSFRQFITDNLQDAGGVAKKVFSSVGVGGLAVVGFLVNVLLIPVVLFYVLRDWDHLVASVDSIIPRRFHATVSGLTREIDAILSEFLRGQLSVMLMMAVFYVAGLWLVGLNFALPVGIITGLLVFVPYLGSGTGLLLGTVAAVMQFPSMTGVMLVWAVFAIGQILEGFVVTPWLVGDRIGLHPVAVIFALLAFGQVFGFFGLLLALPASAAILVGLRHLQANYRGSDLYRK
jgi:predicted PurR-regulated permease PerM